jgi:lipopolysaccharide/colanic/teichoic acid biosynthesis glycosyltransferase
MHCFVLLFVDVVLVAVSTIAAIVLCSPEAPLSALARIGPYAIITLATAVPVLLVFRLNRTVWRFTSLSDSLSVVGATVAIVAVTIAVGFSFDRLANVPRSVPVMQGLLILYALGGIRIAMRIRHVLRRRAQKSKSAAGRRENVLLVGLNPIADLFIYCASENGHGSTEVVGILSEAERHRGRMLRSRKILGPPESIDEILHDLSIHGVFVDRIVLASPASELSEKAQKSLLDIGNGGNVRVDCLSTRFGLGDGERHSEAEGCRLREASAVDPHFDSADFPPATYLRWKRLVDAAVALFCIVCFLPLMLFVFLVVRLDVGSPAIFWQQRPGAGGRPIRVLKFRTMGPGRGRDGRALSDAQRLSKIGRLLRRLRLDELPQVYNVLFGHMSLVGPRPLLPVDQPTASAARLRLRPGLTGWAQIKGGRRLSIEDKAALDLWYIKNASFTLDMVILAHTARTILFGERVDRRAIHEARQDLRSDRPALLSVEGPEHTLV